MIAEHEIVIPLENGGSLRCGEGGDYQWGGYLRICDAEGNELVYWDINEVEESAEEVIGACFAFSQKPIKELLTTLRKTKVQNGCWI